MKITMTGHHHYFDVAFSQHDEVQQDFNTGLLQFVEQHIDVKMLQTVEAAP